MNPGMIYNVRKVLKNITQNRLEILKNSKLTPQILRRGFGFYSLRPYQRVSYLPEPLTWWKGMTFWKKNLGISWKVILYV